MSARFRIRTAQGQELSFASREIFAEFVRSGDLAPDDVVYDAETREWSSARTHPVVLQIELEAEDASRAAADDEASEGADDIALEASAEDEHLEGGSSEDELTAEEPGPDQAADISLDLAPVPQGLTPEEEAAAFVAKMEAERASEMDHPEEPSIETFMVDQASETVDGADRPSLQDAAGGGRSREVAERRERAPARPSRGKTRKSKPPKRKKAGSGPGRKLAPFMILAVAVVAAAVYLGPDLLAPDEGSGNAVADTAASEPPPLIPDTEEALRRRARERYLASTQALLRDLEPIPDVWLHGQYLASPSDYPHVREVWESYVTTIQGVKAGDDERYRAAYLRALNDARIQGSARTLRMAAATADFKADSTARYAFYDRVEALATAAVQGHDALVDAEGTISYEPATGPRVSADPVIEAVGRNAEAQALLDRVLDGILVQLHADDGPGESRHVREWVWDGFLDAVTG